MYLKFFAFVMGVLLTMAAAAQNGRLTGKVTNTRNEPLANVSVQIGGMSKGTATGIDGSFTLLLPPGTKYEISISCIGYESKILTEVEVLPGKVTDLSVVLNYVQKNNVQEVTIKAPARKESIAALINYQRNTAVVAQVISAEAIRRSPDRNTGEVLKRVPGTSVQEGKYLVVRGLADRYNQAMLNGILLSSTEPDRKTFSFDLFPSQVIDNIIMNKTFVPELPGEWAGGLVQVNTKDIPAGSFLSIQLGTGFNTNTIGRSFLQAPGGKLDWLGIDDGSRGLPAGMPVKSAFATLSQEQQNEWGKKFRNTWKARDGNAPLNTQFQLNGGFNTKVLGKKLAAVFALTYNQTNRNTSFNNAVIANNDGTLDLYYNNAKYSRDVLAGAMANLSLQFNTNNRLSLRNIINVNSSDFVIDRFDGRDYILGPGNGDKVRAQELGFKQNTFYATQLIGEHLIKPAAIRLKWYGGFNILDQYIPDQRRLFYTQDENQPTGPYYALLGAGSSQKSGSIFYSFLNDYIYNAGGDVSRSFKWFKQQQTIKAGYLFQVKDRLFDSRPFFLNTLSNNLRILPSDQIFAPANFGTAPTQVQFGELTGKPFRYMANTILNAAYLQSDNQLGEAWRLVWGVRYERFDQLVGSVKQSDERHVHTIVNDWLPGLNLTYKVKGNTNIRFSASQTVIRPEFRELSPFAFYDFELNAQVVGNKTAQRTKVTNLDLRYELYPRSGELFTAGVFFKHFRNPIEYYFNRTGPATNTFNISNTDQAISYGAEVEFRKKLDAISLLKNFTVSGNLSYIYSRVKDTVSLSRPLQGQSPYLLNIGLQYDHEKSGWSATLLFNQIGRRILFVGNEAVSDIWEAPRPLLDFQIVKKVLHSKGECKLSVSDILNRRAFFYHDLDNNGKYSSASKDVLAIDRVYGTNITISFAYSIK